MTRGVRFLIVSGALALALGVALGAVAAHAAGRAPHPDAARLLQTAALYQMVHGLGLILGGVLARFAMTRWLAMAAAAFLLGLGLFCGALCWLALTGASPGPLAPVGGASFIVGWILLAIHALAAERAGKPQDSAARP